MRLFLAIDLPPETKRSLFEQLTPLRGAYPVFNWVQENNFHLTIHFFGETNELGRIVERTRDLLFDQDPFMLYGYECGLFMGKQLTLYLGMRREKRLEELAARVRDTFGGEFHEVKRFVPHITLARYKITSKQQYLHLQKRLTRQEVDIEFPVGGVTLFESVLTGKKPAYIPKETFRFGT